MAAREINHIDGPEVFAAGFGVSRETVDRLVTYEAMLRRWQKTINLVAASTLPDIWHRHFADSAQLWSYRPPEAKRWLDLGSGAGFPGLVLAIMAAEAGGTHHTLVESDSRKAAFLREAAREVGVAVDILCMRIENPKTRDRVAASHCVTARALAPLPRLIALSAPYFSPATTGMFLKGREVEAEVAEAEESFAFSAELKPSLTDAHGRVVLLKALTAKAQQP